MRNFVIIYFLLFGTFFFAGAQEVVIPLQIDGDLNNFYQQNHHSFKHQKIAEPMFLPFFDDFNQSSYRAKEDLWMGDNVFVNKKFQLFPADLGVATFDAMDGSGHLHSNASSFPFPADTLTSQAIRLDSVMDPTLRPLLVSDSIYFSFYYQPQGRGNDPGEEDELSLEFYSPSLDQWYEVWSSPGMKLDSFLLRTDSNFMQQVFIPLVDSAKFFHSGFQFRFHNLASLAGSNQPDWQSNCDHWNIDLVWLDRGRTITDSSYRKIAFVNEPPAMIKRYQNMPYRQYRNDPSNSMKESIDSIIISNLYNDKFTVTYSYSISNQSSQDSLYDGGSAIVFPYATDGYVDYERFSKPEIGTFFSVYLSQRETYTVTHIINDIGLTGVGDTAYRVHDFSNFYSYDDGTPEAGYGFANNASKCALQYKLNTKDTLTRVQMYFNPTLTSANENNFYILVYKSLDPEELLYKKRFKVEFTDGLYNFVTFDLDTNLVLANEFYLGFEQITDDLLNVGMDYAQDSREYLYYNIGSGWLQSIHYGSLMMRPEFGSIQYTGLPLIKPVQEKWSIYPNPVFDSYLNMEYNVADKSGVEIQFYNLTGQLVYQTFYEDQIDVSRLQPGVYLLRMIDQVNKEVQTRKLIVR